MTPSALQPPRLARWLAYWLAPREEREFLLGDLDETFASDAVPRYGLRRARLWYWRQALAAALAHGSRPVVVQQPSRKGDNAMQSLLQDMSYGLRMLRKSPGFTAVAVLTLALGIGVNAAMFSVVNGLMFAALPFPSHERLVQLWEANAPRNLTQVSVAYGNFVTWKERSRSFDDMVLYSTDAYNLAGDGDPQRLLGVTAGANLFTLLEREPALGRAFAAGDDAPGGDPIVVLSHGLWQRHYGSDLRVVGRTVRLNDKVHTIVGVMPEDFFFPRESVDVWIPGLPHDQRESRNARGFNATGRLKPGVSIQQASTELNGIARQLSEQFVETNKDWGVQVRAVRDELMPTETGLILTILYLAVVAVLLIACANVASLLLARAASRQREIAVRIALGGSRARVLRQLLTESIVLAALGGAAGVVVAHWGLRALQALAPPQVPLVQDIEVSSTILLYLAAVSLLTGIIFGLAPAVQATRPQVQSVLKEGGRGAGGGRHRLLKSLVVAEVALSLVLLVCGGLLVRSFVERISVDPGFDTRNLLTFRVSLTGPRYKEDTAALEFHRRVLDGLAAQPGVEHVGAVQTIPLGGSNSFIDVTIEGAPPRAPGDRNLVGYMVVTPDYFRAMRIPLRAGRFFTDQDTAGAPGVAIVNEEFVRMNWPTEPNPVGRQFRRGGPDSTAPWLMVAGVVANVQHRNLGTPPRPEMFLPMEQEVHRSVVFIARTASDAASLGPAVRSVVQAADRDIPIAQLRTMDDLIANRMAGQRATAEVMGGVAGLALILAAVGIYGMVAYTVSQRTHEIGVRMALGAHPANIFRMVLRQGLLLVSIGLLLGLGGAFGASRALGTLLFGITPNDPWTYAAVVLLLLGVAAAACLIPARRATRVNPVIALRYE